MQIVLISTALIIALGMAQPAFAAAPTEGASAPSTIGTLDPARLKAEFQMSREKIQEFSGLPDDAMSGPKETDFSYIMLKKILGEPVVHAMQYFDNNSEVARTSNGGTAVTMVLGIMPTIALFLAAVYMLYIYFGGMFKMGRSGEFLGKKWDSVIVPFRVTSSVLLLQPLPGFAPLAGIQVIILIFVLMSFGVASWVWKESATALMTKPVIEYEIPKAGEFVDSVLRASVCRRSLEQDGQLEKLKDGVLFVKQDPPNAVVVQHTPDGPKAMSYTEDAKYYELFVDKKRVCGSAKVYRFDGEHMLTGTGVAVDDTDRMRNNMTKRAAKNMGPWVNRVFKEMDKLAKRIIEINKISQLEDREKEKQQITTEFRKKRAEFVSKYTYLLDGSSKGGSELSQFEKKLLKDLSDPGFVMAGLYYWQMARFQDMHAAILEGGIQTVFDVSQALEDDGFVAWFKSFFSSSGISDTAREQLKNRLGIANAIIQEGSPINAAAAAAKANEGTTNSIFAGLTQSMASGMTNFARLGTDASELNPSPMTEVKSMGNKIQAAIMAFMAAMAIVGLFTGSIPLIGSDSGGSSMLMTFFTIVVLMLMGISFYYANILPALPTLYWLIAVMSLFVYVLAVLAASPFWMAVMASPESQHEEDFFGRGAQGYQVLLTVILYPVLMVVGLVLAMAFVRVGGWLINGQLFAALRSMNAGGVNVMSFVGNLVVFALAYTVLIHKSFSLTRTLPSTVLAMMGVGQDIVSDLGEQETQQRAESANARATQELHMAGSRGMSAVMSGGKGG